MYTSCILHVYFMYTSCILPVYFLYTSCILPVYFLYTSCILPVYFLYTSCILPVYFLYTSCILPVYFLYTSCILHVYFMYTSCILHVYFMYTSCILHVYFMYTSCILHVYFLYTSCIFLKATFTKTLNNCICLNTWTGCFYTYKGFLQFNLCTTFGLFNSYVTIKYAKFHWLIAHVQFSFQGLSVYVIPRLTDSGGDTAVPVGIISIRAPNGSSRQSSL